jgi:hypothetical protein
MKDAGSYLQLLIQQFNVKSPFIAKLWVIGVKDVYFVPVAEWITHYGPSPEKELNPECCRIDITCDPANYSDVVGQFAAGMRPALDFIWRETGLNRDEHYDAKTGELLRYS